jgi:hypothetical protein
MAVLPFGLVSAGAVEAEKKTRRTASQATRLRKLYPTAARMALAASPAPAMRLHPIQCFGFHMIMTGSTAALRRSARRIPAVTPRV